MDFSEIDSMHSSSIRSGATSSSSSDEDDVSISSCSLPSDEECLAGRVAREANVLVNLENVSSASDIRVDLEDIFSPENFHIYSLGRVSGHELNFKKEKQVDDLKKTFGEMKLLLLTKGKAEEFTTYQGEDIRVNFDIANEVAYCEVQNDDKTTFDIDLNEAFDSEESKSEFEDLMNQMKEQLAKTKHYSSKDFYKERHEHIVGNIRNPSSYTLIHQLQATPQKVNTFAKKCLLNVVSDFNDGEQVRSAVKKIFAADAIKSMFIALLEGEKKKLNKLDDPQSYNALNKQLKALKEIDNFSMFAALSRSRRDGVDHQQHANEVKTKMMDVLGGFTHRSFWTLGLKKYQRFDPQQTKLYAELTGALTFNPKGERTELVRYLQSTDEAPTALSKANFGFAHWLVQAAEKLVQGDDAVEHCLHFEGENTAPMKEGVDRAWQVTQKRIQNMAREIDAQPNDPSIADLLRAAERGLQQPLEEGDLPRPGPNPDESRSDSSLSLGSSLASHSRSAPLPPGGGAFDSSDRRRNWEDEAARRRLEEDLSSRSSLGLSSSRAERELDDLSSLGPELDSDFSNSRDDSDDDMLMSDASLSLGAVPGSNREEGLPRAGVLSSSERSSSDFDTETGTIDDEFSSYVPPALSRE